MQTTLEIAPEIILSGLEGQVHSLSEVQQNGNNVLLIFLRHLG